MINLIHNFSRKFCKPDVPDLKTGYQVRVYQKVKEGNKERVQIFEGIIIGKNSGYSAEETFTVRKISEGIGVEKVFPVHLSSIEKIEVVRAHKVRRARLNYLRELSGKALRLKEVPLKLRKKEFVEVSVGEYKKEENKKVENEEKLEEKAKNEFEVKAEEEVKEKAEEGENK